MDDRRFLAPARCPRIVFPDAIGGFSHVGHVRTNVVTFELYRILNPVQVPDSIHKLYAGTIHVFCWLIDDRTKVARTGGEGVAISAPTGIHANSLVRTIRN